MSEAESNSQFGRGDYTKVYIHSWDLFCYDLCAGLVDLFERMIRRTAAEEGVSGGSKIKNRERFSTVSANHVAVLRRDQILGPLRIAETISAKA